MVNVRPTNAKLVDRAHRILAAALGCDMAEAVQLFTSAGDDLKAAIVMGKLSLSREQAQQRLAAANGVLSAALRSIIQTA
jgi:N-acetylmuramic acid 6-phosphate etherase